MIEVSKVPSKEPENSGSASQSLKDHEVNTLFGTDVSHAWMLWLSCLGVVALLLGCCGSLAWIVTHDCLKRNAPSGSRTSIHEILDRTAASYGFNGLWHDERYYFVTIEDMSG